MGKCDRSVGIRSLITVDTTGLVDVASAGVRRMHASHTGRLPEWRVPSDIPCQAGYNRLPRRPTAIPTRQARQAKAAEFAASRDPCGPEHNTGMAVKIE